MALWVVNWLKGGLILCFIFQPLEWSNILAQEKSKDQDVILGAYYFNGWSERFVDHITPRLKDSFDLRKPKWGWATSQQRIMDEELKVASSAGLSFFSYCWYFTGKESFRNHPLNQGVKHHLVSKNRHLMNYNLMVANHGNFEISPDNWEIVIHELGAHFRNINYQLVNGKPLITFYSLGSLIKTFGGVGAVRQALDRLRNVAVINGQTGLTIAVVSNPNIDEIVLAERCGVDILTGYNYHSYGFTTKTIEIPIDSMQSAEKRIWNKFAKLSKLPYIPSVTLNWDPRPWANKINKYDKRPYYVGYSAKSVQSSVVACLDWLNTNVTSRSNEKVAVLYAWNENGEGAWLTPGKSKKKQHNYLNGVKEALKRNSKDYEK